MSHRLASDPRSDVDPLEVAVDEAIAACDGDMRATIKALIVANEFLESSISHGYVRGSLPTDRKNWYD